MSNPPPSRRNPVLIGATVAIAALVVAALVSGYMLFSYVGDYGQRVAAPLATAAAALTTPADLPSPAPAYDPSITPVVTQLIGRPVIARSNVTLLVGPFTDAPPVKASDGTLVTVAQGHGAIAIASTSDGWQMLHLDNGAEGWVPPDALK